MVASSATYRDCIALIRRYIRLLNDAVELDVEIREGTAIAQWSYSLALGRVLTDFLMASLYLALARRATAVPDLRLEICFAHEEPDDTRLYRRIFRAGLLRFSAPFDGFVFDEHLLDRPTTGGDPTAFHRAFRRWRGQSPSEYRREHRLAAADRDSREPSF